METLNDPWTLFLLNLLFGVGFAAGLSLQEPVALWKVETRWGCIMIFGLPPVHGLLRVVVVCLWTLYAAALGWAASAAWFGRRHPKPCGLYLVIGLALLAALGPDLAAARDAWSGASWAAPAPQALIDQAMRKHELYALMAAAESLPATTGDPRLGLVMPVVVCAELALLLDRRAWRVPPPAK